MRYIVFKSFDNKINNKPIAFETQNPNPFYFSFVYRINYNVFQEQESDYHSCFITAPFDFYHSFQCIASKNFSFTFSTIPIYNCLLCLNCYISDFYNLHQNTLEINFIKWSNRNSRNSRNAGTIFSRIWSSLQVIWFALPQIHQIKSKFWAPWII